MAKSYESLETWQNAIDLAVKIYDITKLFPNEEIYGLTSQIRRAVVSISSNIAEGSSRPSKKDYRHFVDIAIGSLNEVENLLIVSYRLNFIEEENYFQMKELIEKEGRLLGGLRRFLEDKDDSK